jgi:Spy/CpxP family protein refolding chaperone
MNFTRTKLAALLLALGFGIAAHAAPPTPDAPPQDHGGAFAAHEGKRLDELHQQLALDKNQEAQWQSARQTTERLHREMMEAHRAAHDNLKAALDAPNPDLRALTAQMDKMRDEQMQKHKQAREAWLKFYDSLNSAQKDKARHFLLAQISMMGEFGPGHPGMHRDHGGEGGMGGVGGPDRMPPHDGPRPSNDMR